MIQTKQTDELIDIFCSNRDENLIPTLDEEQWSYINSLYDKETIIESLIGYIKLFKPLPPINPLTYEDMVSCFYDLSSKDAMDFYLPFGDVKDRVYEKFDDYQYKFKDYGLGVVQMGNAFINVSNYFNQKLRMECGTYGFKSAHERWKTGEDLRTVFLALWRMGNNKLDARSFVAAFRLSTYIATQFKPHVAKFIYDVTEAETVFDSSCGWGDRLAGFFCSDAKEYYGCDPNPEVFEMYKFQIVSYMRLKAGGDFNIINNEEFAVYSKKIDRLVSIRNCAAEDYPYENLPDIDCAFTSPPYFSTELYGKGKPGEENQSWSRYQDYSSWRDNFYLPVNERTFEKLSKNGLQIVNIQDPVVSGQRFKASDDLINHMTTKYTDCNFIGNLGMRIMQRPRNIEKEKLLDLFGKIYIEPMWVFGKNRDYFMKENQGLLDYM